MEGSGLSPLMAIGPVDGRYQAITAPLSDYFSEYALIKYRYRVEIEYFIFLVENTVGKTAAVTEEQVRWLHILLDNFSMEDAAEIKAIEQETRHDVKALEYYLRKRFAALGLGEYLEYIHFGLTSQDINNTAIPLSIKEALHTVLLPSLESFLQKLQSSAQEWSAYSMLARTHGQPASPTNLGKEIAVFHYRLHKVLEEIKSVTIEAKFGGATGNFNAHLIAFPEVDWLDFGNRFCRHLGLVRQQFTTQIENYDTLASLFMAMTRLNTVLLDFNRDMWQYISMGYFTQQLNKNEVGSSAMPHKVNPIDFENSEGNMGMANALFMHLAQKLPVSRLQRDLTDSTVLRNVGLPLAYTLIAFESATKGLNKVMVNPDAIQKDLDDNYAVLAEAVQTMMRLEGIPNAYDIIKAASRTGKPMGKAEIESIIRSSGLSEERQKQLLALTPGTYTGIFPEI